MSKLIHSVVGLLFGLFVLAIGVSAQQAAGQRPRVPSMSSDDTVGQPSTKATIVTPIEGDKTPAGWTRYSLEGCGMSVALPGAAPLTVDMPVPNQLKTVLLYSRNHLYEGKGYFLLASHTLLTVEVPVRPVAEGWIQVVSNQPGISNFKYSVGPEQSAERVSLKGSYDKAGVPVAFSGFAQRQGKHLWLVVAVHEQANKPSAEEARKALASAALDGPECDADQ